jgi:hypothetical protein
MHNLIFNEVNVRKSADIGGVVVPTRSAPAD